MSQSFSGSDIILLDERGSLMNQSTDVAVKMRDVVKKYIDR